MSSLAFISNSDGKFKKLLNELTGDSQKIYFATAFASMSGFQLIKPALEKMIEGRMKKFFSEVTLLGQDFVIDPDLTVQAASEKAEVEIVGYVRMAVGEGIEKKEEDFAAEVAKAAQG